MDLASLLVILALAIIVVGFIGRPLIEKRIAAVTDVSRYNSELQAEKDQILMNLQELDLDQAMGKLPVGEYESRRTSLVARGSVILKEIDRLEGATGVVSSQIEETAGQNTEDLEAQIEMEIRQRRGKVSAEVAGYCPQCGQPLHAGDRFCTKCGSQVHVTEAER
jgi:hypothetical protein